MPTSNPRITITLEPSQSARLKRLSELSGNSQASFISELIGSSMPVVDRLIRLMEAANEVRSGLTDDLVADMEASQARVEAQLGLALDDFDSNTSVLLDMAESVKRRKVARGMRSVPPATSPAPRPTPISNRGVRSTKKPSRTVP
uniref:Uncharacterized protein n=1 Tax=uncultured prokaryote TaxID=198431 RepID=A0A0H5QL99_9ZZZZ|nr:hypothetical protein [uncultured prokaryote]